MNKAYLKAWKIFYVDERPLQVFEKGSKIIHIVLWKIIMAEWRMVGEIRV